MATTTHGTLRNASRRDALKGVVDDYLIRHTCRYEGAKKWPQAPEGQSKIKKETETYWDKKTGVLRATSRPKQTL